MQFLEGLPRDEARIVSQNLDRISDSLVIRDRNGEEIIQHAGPVVPTIKRLWDTAIERAESNSANSVEDYILLSKSATKTIEHNFRALLSYKPENCYAFPAEPHEVESRRKEYLKKEGLLPPQENATLDT